MSRKKIKQIRQEELIDATINAIHQQGYVNVTSSQIARLGNAATGSINYHFGSKSGLLEATMRHLLKVLNQSVIERLKLAKTPYERVVAIINGNFDDRLFTIAKCSVWVQFWSSAPYEASLARLQMINRARVRSNLRSALKPLLDFEASETVRHALQAYMDGVWIQAAQSNKELNPPKARRKATDFINMLIGPKA